MASAAIMETYSELQARYEDLLRGEVRKTCAAHWELRLHV